MGRVFDGAASLEEGTDVRVGLERFEQSAEAVTRALGRAASSTTTPTDRLSLFV